MKMNGYEVRQIKLPDRSDTDPHPRLMFGNWGIHAGEGFLNFVRGYLLRTHNT